MQTSCIEPDNARDFRGANHQNPAGDNQSITFESIMVSARANAPANDDRLHGRVRLCRSCGAETESIGICPACIEAERAERAAALDERCRIHRVRHVEDLPISVIEEMQAARGWA